MIGCFNCPITGVRLRPTVRLHCPITILQKNKTATVPITFEEIVMVMINVITELFFSVVTVSNIYRATQQRSLKLTTWCLHLFFFFILMSYVWISYDNFERFTQYIL